MAFVLKFVSSLMTPFEENQVVKELLRSLDHHSEGEWDHAERVAVYSVAIGGHLKLTDDELRTLRLAAVLHDVGKVRISQSVLQKMSRLNESDLNVLRLHAELATEVIGQIEFLRPTRPAIRHHHERWDGTGYPNKLAGTDIPLMARIIAVAEAFDILAIGSPWSPAIFPDAAFDEIERSAGTQFDPEVVAALDSVRRVIQPVGQLP